MAHDIDGPLAWYRVTQLVLPVFRRCHMAIVAGGGVSPTFQTMTAHSELAHCVTAGCATSPGPRMKASILVVFMTTVFQEMAEGVRDMLAGVDVDVDLHKPEPVAAEFSRAALAYAPLSSPAAGYDVVLIIGAHMLPRPSLPEFYIVFRMEQLTSRYMTPPPHMLGVGGRVGRCVGMSSLWGAHRDAVVVNASVVLNMHFYEGASLEVHRINYLLGRQKCVVSERSLDGVLDSVYSGAVEFAAFDQLPAAAVEMAMNALRRRELERAGAALMLGIHQDPSPLFKALSELRCTSDETEAGGGQHHCSCGPKSNPHGMQMLRTPERQMYGFSHASRASAVGLPTSTLSAAVRNTHPTMLSPGAQVRAAPITAACDELRCQINGHTAHGQNVNTTSLPLLWAPATGLESRKRSRVA